MKQIRKRLTYANVMSSIAVFLVVGGGAAFAASHLAKNSVGAKQLKANAVTTAKIKKNAVTAKKIKSNAVINNKLADGAVTTTKIASGAVGEAQIGANAAGNSQTRLVKVFKAGAVPAATEEATAPKIELGSVGPFHFYGKCFKVATNVQEKTYVELTGGTATIGSEDGVELPTPAKQEYLTPVTPEAQRFLEDDAVAAAEKVTAVSNDEEFQASATDGTEITGLVGGTAAKQGSPPIGDGPLLAGDSCIVGTVAIFGG